jgi:hypothetical protein
MKINQFSNDGTSNMFLTGSILMANLDPSSLGDYALKACIGGAIWMVCKIAGDYISEKLKNK